MAGFTRLLKVKIEPERDRYLREKAAEKNLSLPDYLREYIIPKPVPPFEMINK